MGRSQWRCKRDEQGHCQKRHWSGSQSRRVSLVQCTTWAHPFEQEGEEEKEGEDECQCVCRNLQTKGEDWVFAFAQLAATGTPPPHRVGYLQETRRKAALSTSTSLAMDGQSCMMRTNDIKTHVQVI